jgi:hypothetical protein
MEPINGGFAAAYGHVPGRGLPFVAAAFFRMMFEDN